jgi:hypothetical protein
MIQKWNQFIAFLNRNATYLSTIIAVIAVVAALISTTAILRSSSNLNPELDPNQGWRRATTEELQKLPEKVAEELAQRFEANKQKSPEEVEKLLKKYTKTKTTK